MLLNELLPEVRELAATDKLRLIRILAEEVEADVVLPDPGRTYTLATPAFEPGAAEALLKELETVRGR